ncbi:MAG: hypothetical protein LBE22_11655 [Azoarcus sp.]|jgi:hypothetical protein|nr:hypothetical protein [Azoarcus sp.]
MKFETFKPGRWQQRLQYKSFEPVPVDHDWQWEDSQINVLLEAANRALGELNITDPTAQTLIKELIRLKILTEITGQERDRVYVFGAYLDLFGPET